MWVRGMRRAVRAATLALALAMGTTTSALAVAGMDSATQPLPQKPPPLRPKKVRPPLVISPWARDIAASTDIPARAVQAYLVAAGRLKDEQPQCKLAWNTLAAIGAIESGHGSFGDSALGRDGVARPAIIGPALAPKSGYASIRPTPEYTAIHGDTSWDHALGPMQFIGSTWSRWGTDGDGDGIADPLDIDDAAVTAGRYLCASGGELKDGAWQSAVLSYNNDPWYAWHVLSRALDYAQQTQAAAGNVQ